MNPTVTINRHKQQNNPDIQRLGELIGNDHNGKEVFRCNTLELPTRKNEFQRDSIPTGNYNVVRRWSPKFKNHFHVKDVRNRSYILIHSGNYYTDILGCILVGLNVVDINGDGILDVTSSRDTLDKLLDLFPDGFNLQINQL